MPAADGQHSSRSIYLPTVAIAILAAWLSWRGWTAPRPLSSQGPLEDNPPSGRGDA